MKCIIRPVHQGSREADLLRNKEVLLTPLHAIPSSSKWVKEKGASAGSEPLVQGLVRHA